MTQLEQWAKEHLRMNQNEAQQLEDVIKPIKEAAALLQVSLNVFALLKLLLKVESFYVIVFNKYKILYSSALQMSAHC
jgi:hypothetical protein